MTSPTRPAAETAEPLLELNNVEVLYDDVILVLRGLSLAVAEGHIATLLGPNGAGKSTTLKAISGLLEVEDGEVTDGTIRFAGEDLRGLDAAAVVRSGIFQVIEGRRVFEHLSVEDNLRAGAYTRPPRSGVRDDIRRVYDYFPRLGERARQRAGYLSGGEQQMLAVGRALMARPRMLLLDEPSLGLAPLLVKDIFEIIRRINREEGTTILLVEQNARLALDIADYGYVMEGGRVVLEGTADVLRSNADVKEFYLGLGDVGRRSYRDVKHYRRRKRWLS
ncbi:MAG: ABC transporter ATP-binding protein [Gemmatimonadota bacterium]|nr:ABC transporter ATP-binding protein [Gemmatimonadota bacterium]